MACCSCTMNCLLNPDCPCRKANQTAAFKYSDPYNLDGKLLPSRKLIIECGPLCACQANNPLPAGCQRDRRTNLNQEWKCGLTVSQTRLQHTLYMTYDEKKGFCVHTKYPIARATYVCGYAGELKDVEKEAHRLSYVFNAEKIG